MKEHIAVIGLGYVGLPIAVAFAKRFPKTLGFDISAKRIDELQNHIDRTGEVETEELSKSTLQYSANPGDLKEATFFVVTVPTPIDPNKQPDLSALIRASSMLGKYLKKGDVVVYESTVYPGVTEEVCGPILAETSGLVQGEDFKLGYSPERINPGDKEHTLERVIKVVSGEDDATLERVASVYGAIIEAGIHKAPSIKVAEAAKVIENVQRDLNIALMNELALIFDRFGIRTSDVLAAAGTKWNFLPFVPGLVGGHCIGVDPYYLTAKAETLGYHPEIILAGRRINDAMGGFVAQRTIKMMIQANISVKNAKVGVLGLTFKENVPDLRNSRVPDIITELQEFGVQTIVHDPMIDAKEAKEEYGFSTQPWEQFQQLDALILAVPHRYYLEMSKSKLFSCLHEPGVFVDVKGVCNPQEIPPHLSYWSL